MSALPVICAFGGISPAGRSSCQHGFHRLVYSALDSGKQQSTLAALGALTNREATQQRLDDTLIRRLNSSLFAREELPFNIPGLCNATVTLDVRRMDLPATLPPDWRIDTLDGTRCRVTLPAGQPLLASSVLQRDVQAAGQLPDGFDPASLYPARNHPRGLQMAIYAASDCLGMAGIPWQRIVEEVNPEHIAVYASSAMSQLDDAGLGGMMKYPLQGKRITSKQCALGLAEMPADFINAYVLGNIGRTGGMLGACASFLYNLSAGVHDIRSGRARVVLVGTSEAPLVAEVFEGYRAMGALARDDDLLALDPERSTPDWRRACRPFANNCGFTLAESAQCVLLMDDALALELGADILATVPDVFIHADGIKKSISAPGPGNFLTLARATALARDLLGEHAVRHHSFVSAHGTGTPQNRVTESRVLNEIAQAFMIAQWPVTAIKCYLGHSLATAAGDQLMAALGTFTSGILPGISTLDRVADDVHHQYLDLRQAHQQLATPQAAFLNAKGFGGNNATALVLSAQASLPLLEHRHGRDQIAAWQDRREETLATRADYDQAMLRGEQDPVYRYGEAGIDEDELDINDRRIILPGEGTVSLRSDNAFADYLPPRQS